MIQRKTVLKSRQDSRQSKK